MELRIFSVTSWIDRYKQIEMDMTREILSEEENLAVKNRLNYQTNHCTACERKCKIKIILSTINVRLFFRNIMNVQQRVSNLLRAEIDPKSTYNIVLPCALFTTLRSPSK